MAGAPQPTPGPGGANRGLLRSPLRRMYGDPRHLPANRVNQSDRPFQPHRRQHSHSLPVASARAGLNEPTTNSTRAQPPFPRLMSRRGKHRDPAPPTGAEARRPSFSPSRARKGLQTNRTQACTHRYRPTPTIKPLITVIGRLVADDHPRSCCPLRPRRRRTRFQPARVPSRPHRSSPQPDRCT